MVLGHEERASLLQRVIGLKVIRSKAAGLNLMGWHKQRAKVRRGEEAQAGAHARVARRLMNKRDARAEARRTMFQIFARMALSHALFF